MVIHWNAAKRCGTGRLQACQVAAALLRAARVYDFEAHIGLVHRLAWYTPVGCDSLKVLLVLGTLVQRAQLLCALNQSYNTSILADQEVKEQVLEDALFLIDVVHNTELGLNFEPIYQLVPEAMGAQTAGEEEWMYVFRASTENPYPEKEWASCASAFHRGDFLTACSTIAAYLGTHASSDPTARLRPSAEFVRCILEHARSQAHAPHGEPRSGQGR
eukprot:RCo035522